MTGVDRRDFIPDVIWPFARETYGSAVDRTTDPDGWKAAVSADVPVVTQWDNGAHTGPEPGAVASSSASMPKPVATMLTALLPDTRASSTYLDVGTGTGYTAARIAEAVGPSGFVITIEVDEQLAETPRENLENAGVRNVEVIRADGFEGWPDKAPYNGVHVTCGIRQISHEWIRQTTPGGRIVMPWGTDYTPHDRLLTLEVNEDGTALGRFGVGLSFMKMRAQRLDFPGHAAYAPPGWDEAAHETESDLQLTQAKEVITGDGAFAVSLRVPDCVQNTAPGEDGSVSIWLYSTRDRSVAVASFGEETAPDIVQAGPRSLWDEVERAREWWVDNERPEPARMGLTIGPEQQRAWLDNPDTGSWALP
ncbi:methyltransferase domain-containing protein [Embleya sp. NPDC059237]|uniref:methyltransferase domain-containing protein n=1 Tax=Embleya sp. NPDC059237 TaxID=3346784 RepID=UPI00368F2A67